MAEPVLVSPDAPDSKLAFTSDTGRSISYGELRSRAQRLGDVLRGSPRGLVLCLLPRTVEAIVAYVGAIESKWPVVPLEVRDGADLSAMVRLLSPDLAIAASSDALALSASADYDLVCSLEDLDLSLFRLRPPSSSRPAVHPELALVVRTSGSIGTPKPVRLSRANVQANARAIAQSMRLSPNDRGVSSAPLDFAGGLSVLHSHLCAGASLLVTASSPVTKDFWKASAAHEVTNVYAVPVTCRLLRALHWCPQSVPTLRLMCQAAGWLDTETVAHFAGLLRSSGGGFAVMYGQTEATARMTYLPPHEVHEYPRSVGSVIAGGTLSVAGAEGAGQDETEIVYRGPNVMMGYARSRADLALGDMLHGVLHTGDVGRLEAGRLYLRGRIDRMVKLSGRRVQLEDIEAFLSERAEVAITSHGDRLFIHTEHGSEVKPLLRPLSTRLGLTADSIALCPMDRLPRTRNGKIDYGALKPALR